MTTKELAERLTNLSHSLSYDDTHAAAKRLLELEAENAQLLADMKLCQAKNRELFAENEQLRKERQAFKDVAEYQKAENAKLRETLLSVAQELSLYVNHQAARAALGENE